MIFLPYLLALFTGYLLFEKLTAKNSSTLPLPLKLVISFGMGLGVAAALTFITFFIIRHFYPPAIIIVHALFTTFLIFISRWENIVEEWTCFFQIRPLSWRNITAGILWATLAFFYYYIATKHPFGQWDAWGMWNLKTKFLILSENPWGDILHRLHTHTHPDYPLLLPFINVWVMSFLGEYSPLAPFTTSLLFALLTPLLIFTGLKIFTPKPAAFFAATILLTHPYVAFWATAQYADAVLAFYLTAAAVLFFLLVNTNTNHYAKPLGIILGLAAFTKNEGLLLVVFLVTMILLSRHLIFQSSSGETTTDSTLMRWLAIGAAPVMLFKLFLSPSNQDILPHLSFTNQGLLDPNKLVFILRAFVTEMFDKRWCFVWIFLLIALVAKTRAFFREDTLAITVTLVLYALAVAVVYQSSSMDQLSWWLDSSLKRLYFTLLPLSLYLTFYTLWRPSDKK